MTFQYNKNANRLKQSSKFITINKSTCVRLQPAVEFFKH